MYYNLWREGKKKRGFITRTDDNIYHVVIIAPLLFPRFEIEGMQNKGVEGVMQAPSETLAGLGRREICVINGSFAAKIR